jgi:hypothetical protein
MEGRVANQEPARCPRHNCGKRRRKESIKKKYKKSAAERRQKGGKNAATQRRISGRNEAYLVLDFRSFLMKADLGKAGLIPLILRRQQQSHSRRCQATEYS